MHAKTNTMNERENYLRTLEFRFPEWIPCSIGFAPAVWNRHREALEDIVLAHPRLFPDAVRGELDFYDEMPPVYRQGETYRDNWGCVWYNAQNGLEGVVVEHPLADWKALANYRMPDPLKTKERGEEGKDWEKLRKEFADNRAKGRLSFGGGERLFDRLYFLRGFENLMIDLVEEPPQLSKLIGMLEAYELQLVDALLQTDVDVIGFHTDIGTQNNLMISPQRFRKHIKPMFKRIFRTCRNAGVHVYLSSDGRLLHIVDDLIECGISAHDPQLRANTLEGIKQAYKGKVCAFVDLDRQSFPFITPEAIHEQVKEVIGEMAMPEGGLGIVAAVYGVDVPLRNMAAICEALEMYCFP